MTEYWPYLVVLLLAFGALACALWWRFAGHRLKWWAAMIDRSATWGVFGLMFGLVLVWGLR